MSRDGGISNMASHGDTCLPAAAVCPHNPPPRTLQRCCCCCCFLAFAPYCFFFPLLEKRIVAARNQKHNRRENTQKALCHHRRAFDLFGHASSHAQPLRCCCNATLAGRAHAREDVFLLLLPSPAARREGRPYLMTVCRYIFFSLIVA